MKLKYKKYTQEICFRIIQEQKTTKQTAKNTKKTFIFQSGVMVKLSVFGICFYVC